MERALSALHADATRSVADTVGGKHAGHLARHHPVDVPPRNVELGRRPSNRHMGNRLCVIWRKLAAVSRDIPAADSTIVSGSEAKMKRLLIASTLFGLIAMPALAADCQTWDTACIARQGAPPSSWAPPGCGYGGTNDPKCKQNPDGSWPGQPQGGWPGQPPPPGGWPQQGSTQPPPGGWPQQGGTQPPPGQQQPCPAITVWDQQAQRCLFKKAETPTQRCQPGWVWVTYGNKGKCVRRGATQAQTGGQCRPGWIYSQRLYRCVPGFAGGTPGTQQDSGRRQCGY